MSELSNNRKKIVLWMLTKWAHHWCQKRWWRLHSDPKWPNPLYRSIWRKKDDWISLYVPALLQTSNKHWTKWHGTPASNSNIFVKLKNVSRWWFAVIQFCYNRKAQFPYLSAVGALVFATLRFPAASELIVLLWSINRWQTGLYEFPVDSRNHFS